MRSSCRFTNCQRGHGEMEGQFAIASPSMTHHRTLANMSNMVAYFSLGRASEDYLFFPSVRRKVICVFGTRSGREKLGANGGEPEI